MIFPTPLRLIFITISIVLVGIEVFLSYLMFKRRNEYKIWIAWPVTIGFFTTIFYCMFLLVGPGSHKLAVLFDSLFFIGTDWLAMLMFMFAIAYTGITLKYRRIILCIACALCGIDSISLIVNNFTGHMFDLVLLYDKFGNFFWANDFKFPHYVHLGLCYVMVGLTFIYFVIITNTVPKAYKSKYSGIFGAYLLVIFANFICYSLNLPIDCSVILYAVLCGFICYYSTYSFPHKLLSNTLESVNETIDDALLYYDVSGNCIYVNRAARQLFQKNKEFDKTAAEVYRTKWIQHIKERGPKDSFEEYFIDEFIVEGKTLHFRVEYQRVYESRRFTGSFLRLIDKTAEINDYKKEKFSATHDELTGLLNRNGFFEAVDEWNRKNGCENRLMLCSNIKDFKLINELFGESVGDSVLKKEAEFLKKDSHSDSIYGRLADDRFGLYMNAENFSEEVMEKYISSVKNVTEKSLYKMHINVGVYNPQGRDESAQIMTDKALMAISTINKDYNKVYAYYDSTLMEQILNEKNIVEDFENAISKGQIQMYLQPIIDSSNKKLGAEALCRWQHPLRGFLLPNDFLPVLEKNGLIYHLDEYIWEQAAIQLSRWRDMGCHDCYISVNVSVKDFFFTDVYKTFTSIVQKYDIDPSTLHIEITESVLMSDYAKAFMLSNKLQKYGFVVAIDNFGSGYSSLNMLKDLKPSVLKIDMALHKNVEEQSRNQIILVAIVDMANSLDMEVVGEGVETKEQYDALMNLNCKIFQGNILAAPMSVMEFEKNFVKYFVK